MKTYVIVAEQDPQKGFQNKKIEITSLEELYRLLKSNQSVKGKVQNLLLENQEEGSIVLVIEALSIHLKK